MSTLRESDPATCIDNLDYAESVIKSVCDRYQHLLEKFLQPFLSAQPEKRFYFCTDGKTVQGPVTHDELRNMQVAGTLNDNTQICEAGTTAWQRILPL